MKKRRAFRPDLNDRLEDRTVPSGIGGIGGQVHVNYVGGGGSGGTGSTHPGGGVTSVSSPGNGSGQGIGLGGLIGELGGLIGGLFGGVGGSVGGRIHDAQTLDIGKVNKAFQTFDQSFLKAYQAYFSALRSGTSSTDAASTFNTAVTDAITKLTTAVDSAIGNLAAANPNLQASVDSAVKGLGTSLAGLTLPTTTGFRAQAKYIGQAFGLISQANGSVNKLIRNANPPAGEVTVSAYNQAVGGIRSAFQAFNKAYKAAAQDSSTNPATNRSAFDTAVGTALGTLNSSIDTALGTALTALPAATLTTLEATIQSDLLTPPTATPAASVKAHAAPTTPKDLQDVLLGIASPTNSNQSLRKFNAQSLHAMDVSYARVVQAVTTTVRTSNDSVNGTGGSSSS